MLRKSIVVVGIFIILSLLSRIQLGSVYDIVLFTYTALRFGYFMNITMDMTHHGHLEVNNISDGIRIAVIGGRLKVTGDIGSNVVISQRYSAPQSCLCRFFSCINPCSRSYVDDRAGVDVAGSIGEGTSIMTEAMCEVTVVEHVLRYNLVVMLDYVYR